ncbi:M48 family metallopeptidase [Umezawaea tangerina]|uniref:Peptidase M48-like protein n=1 Tax=Umezawaea tangerina TaxID=84725 RepID=A0A2T0TL16_9PSEU|nr:M48 family metallopeptidase [Umezawaea tangerina]PRY46363.1 peptidase M48-like protein [Umezawaea tangerina]
MRVALALSVLVGFLVVAVGLVLGPAVLVVRAFAEGHGGAGAVGLGVVAALVALAIGRVVLAAVRVGPEPPGVPVTREAQPELWRVVDELAAVAGTRAPDAVRLVPEVTAAVRERTPLSGLRGGERHLVVGLPLLAGLSVGGLRSVLAHELGHHGGHPRLSATAYRAKDALRLTAARLDGVPGWLFGQFARFYAVLAGPANREQELRADRASVAAAGRDTAQAALRAIGPLSVAWAHFDQELLALVPDAGRTPPVLAGFRAFLGDAEVRERLAAIGVRMLDEESGSVFDSHPAVRERIAAMEAVPAGDAATDDRPSWSLLDHVPELERELVRDAGPAADWPEVFALGHAARAERMASVLADAARTSGTAERGTADEVLAALGRGELLRLGEPLIAAGAPADQLVATATRLLGGAVVAELLRAGRASIALDWSGEPRVVLADGTGLDVDGLVAPAVADPRRAEGARLRVASLCDRTLTD